MSSRAHGSGRPGGHGRWFACCAAIAGVAMVGCTPPPPVGHIEPGPQRKGTVLVSAHGGGGALRGDRELVGSARGVGGALHIEFFASARWSIPVSVSGGRLYDSVFSMEDGTGVDWYGALRVGFRYRLGRLFTLGAGLGGGVNYGPIYAHLAEEPPEYSIGGNLDLDFEWSVGKRWRHVSLSFTQRLTYDPLSRLVFHLVSEIGLAWYPTGGNWGITASAFLAVTLPIYPWGGATAGFTVRL